MQPYASYKCKSPFYETLDTYATPCNNITECFDESDESNCNKNNTATYIFIGSSLAVIIFYLCLKIFQVYREDSIDMALGMNYSIENPPIESYEDHHYDSEVIKEVNIYLLRRILTKRVDVTAIICKQFYDLEVKVHKGKESEIFLCLHQNMDPLIVQNIIDYKFPGLKLKVINYLEKLVGKQCFLWIHNKLKENEKIAKVYFSAKRILAMEFIYLDLLKDTALTFLILHLVGGFPSVLNLYTNFTSVVVILMGSSILIPLLMSSIHLATNNTSLIWKSTSKQKSVFLCFFFMALNPILLKHVHEQAKESMRKLVKYYDHDVVKAMKNCNKIKVQAVKFQKIKLGKLLLLIHLQTDTAFYKN